LRREDAEEAAVPRNLQETAMDTRAKVHDLVDKVLTGRLLEAYDAYYSEDVVMQENTSEPTKGKAANRVREEEFLASIKEFHEAAAPAVVVEGDRAAIHWIIDFTNQDGVRIRYDQVALQTWSEGQIVEERFFYNAG
jgi:ketosteroid isomerase-like protein